MPPNQGSAKQRRLPRSPNKQNRTSCFLGLEDMAKQYPIYPEGGNGFGVVRGEAGGTGLADVDLPAAEIGGGWFHGFRGLGFGG